MCPIKLEIVEGLAEGALNSVEGSKLLNEARHLLNTPGSIHSEIKKFYEDISEAAKSEPRLRLASNWMSDVAGGLASQDF